MQGAERASPTIAFRLAPRGTAVPLTTAAAQVGRAHGSVSVSTHRGAKGQHTPLLVLHLPTLLMKEAPQQTAAFHLHTPLMDDEA